MNLFGVGYVQGEYKMSVKLFSCISFTMQKGETNNWDISDGL